MFCSLGSNNNVTNIGYLLSTNCLMLDTILGFHVLKPFILLIPQ